MNRTTGIVAALAVLSSLTFAADDSVQDSLKNARTEYEQALNEYRTAVREYFDKREEDARKQGNKKLVDQVKADRDAFESTGDLPTSAPATIRSRPASAMSKLAAAYTKAIESYTRNKQDELATATKVELIELKGIATGFPYIAGTWQEGDRKNESRITITQTRNKFVATGKYQHKEAGEIHWRMTGTINKDGEFKAELVHTKAPRTFKNQTRTGKFIPSEFKITGHADFTGGGHDFEWRLID